MTPARRPAAGERDGRRATGLPGLDVPGVQAWMARAVPDATAPVRFARIGDGRSNLTFRASDARSGSWIVRRPPLGPRLRGAHDVLREHRILSALHPAGVPVPQPLGLCDDDAITGAPFYVMELVDGVVVSGRRDLGAFDPGRRRAIARSLVAALAALHAVDVDRVGLGDLARRDAYAERQIGGWWRQWEASRTREVPAIARVRERLLATVPAQRRSAIVHGDYKLENVVVGPDGHVRAILDWELCTLGDPVADLGTLLTYWVEADDPETWSANAADAPTRADGFPTRRELADWYAGATGDPLDSLAFYEALGCWRLAIIAQGVARRFRDTPENANADADVLEAVVEGMADRAERLVG